MSQESRWLRWKVGDEPCPPRDLTEDEFIGEVLQLAEGAFASLPLQPMLVEGLDGPGSSVQWRAYLQHPRDLLGLARQLAVERCLRHQVEGDAVFGEKRSP